MKKIIPALFLFVVITACKIKKDDLKPEQKPISGQLLAYGTNAPLSGAAIDMAKCIRSDFISCSKWEHKKTFSAADGSFQIPRDYYAGDMTIFMPGYWSYISQTDYNYSWYGIGNIWRAAVEYVTNNGELDKLIIKLFPEVKVNVRIKNTSAISETASVFLIAEAFHGNMIPAYPIYLRKGIDTTFEYAAFGNVRNIFTVQTGYYPPMFVANDTLYSNEILLGTASTTSLVINF